MIDSSNTQMSALRARIHTPALRTLFDYWNRKRGDAPFMLQSELEPRDIATVLPLVFILEVENMPRRYRIRLMGTEIATRFGGDHTGRYLDELDFGSAQDQIIAGYDQVVDSVEPHLAFMEFTQSDRGRVEAERLALPMSSDGQTMDRILGAVLHVPFGARDVPKAYKRAPWDPS